MSLSPAKPFAALKEWSRGGASLQFLEDSEFALHVYGNAYRRAAAILTRSTLRLRHRGLDFDASAVPILFLWRHYLELTLKAINIDLAKYNDAPPPPSLKGHSLLSLWKSAEKELRSLILQDEEAKWIGEVIREFSTVDEKSQAFRYPTLKGGAKSAPGLRWVDLRNLADHMMRVSKALEIARSGLDGLLYQKDEAERSASWY
jgi:hypothetical protein